jgi:hypothetical protein
MHGDPADARFGVVLLEGRDRPWHIEPDLTGFADLEARATALAQARYYPTIVTATGADDPDRPQTYRMTAVFEQFPAGSEPSWTYIAPSKWSAFEGAMGSLMNLGFFPVSVDCFGITLPDPVDPDLPNVVGMRATRYVALLYAQPQSKIGTSVRLAKDVRYAAIEPGAYGAGGLAQDDFHGAVMRGWARVENAVPVPWNKNGKRSVMVHYRKDVYERWPADLAQPWNGGAHVLGPFTAAELDQAVAIYDAEGYWPLRIGANGIGTSLRFCMTFARNGRRHPKVRYFRVVDAADVNPPLRVESPTISGSALWRVFGRRDASGGGRAAPRWGRARSRARLARASISTSRA